MHQLFLCSHSLLPSTLCSLFCPFVSILCPTLLPQFHWHNITYLVSTAWGTLVKSSISCQPTRDLLIEFQLQKYISILWWTWCNIFIKSQGIEKKWDFFSVFECKMFSVCWIWGILYSSKFLKLIKLKKKNETYEEEPFYNTEKCIESFKKVCSVAKQCDNLNTVNLAYNEMLGSDSISLLNPKSLWIKGNF